jgi:glutamine synthetase
MQKQICQYLWRGVTLDTKDRETYDCRHKTRVLNRAPTFTLPPIWNYDGSSTRQASTENSVVHLIPVTTYGHPDKNLRDNGAILTLCGTSLQGDTIMSTVEKLSNDEKKLMLGFELECFMIDNNTNLPVGWDGKNLQCTDHYCSTCTVVDMRVQNFLNEVMTTGLEMGLSLTGHNVEVAYGQIELQVCDFALKACYDLEVLKYLMEFIGRKPEYNVSIDYRCKPLGPNHNGSGMHTNASTEEMRVKNDPELTRSIVERLGMGHFDAMKIYGFDNEQRLTGLHETSSFTEFTYAQDSRAVSVRLQSKYDPITKQIVPDATYFEDRRPNPTADQFLIACHIYDHV